MSKIFRNKNDEKNFFDKIFTCLASRMLEAKQLAS